MKRPILAIAAAMALPAVPGVAQADLSFNIGAVTDYRYRGISQSRLKPAVQGGIDFSAGGFYLGTWLTSLKWIKDAGGDASYEADFYGGYKGELAGLGYDVGVLTYQYPSNDLDPSANTTEIYLGLSYSLFTAKYSHSVTNLFGYADSKNSGYLDLSATLDLGDGWSLVPHIGHQRIEHNGKYAYWDYSLTVSKAWGAFSASLGVVGTDTDEYVGPKNKDLGKAGLVAGVKYAF